MKKTLLVLGILLMLSGPLIVLTGTAYTLMLPNLYQSTARITVSEDVPEIDPFAAQETYYSTYNPYFLRTQFEIIQSKPILYEVINRLNLQEEWGKDGEKLPRNVALRILQSSVTVSQQRDTSLIKISVKRDNPMEAAQIANELAVTYRDARLDFLEKEKQRSIDAFQEALKEQQDRVDTAEKTVENLRYDLNISVDGGSHADVDNIRLQQLETDRLVAQSEMSEKSSLLKIMEELEDKELMERASYISFDQEVMNATQQLLDIETQLDVVEKDFGPNHPEVQRYRLQKEKAEEVLERRIEGLMRRLETEYKIAETKFNNLNKILAELRPQVINSISDKYRPFRNAQDNLEAEKFIYKQLDAKLRQEMIKLEVPRNPVEIIDLAEPNNRPVSPNLFMNVLLLLGAGVAPFTTGIVLVIIATKRKRSCPEL